MFAFLTLWFKSVVGSSSGSSGGSSARTESADILQLGNLKHPRYRTMAVRMSSFASWPSYLNQTPEQMAYAGFFHPGKYISGFFEKQDFFYSSGQVNIYW